MGVKLTIVMPVYMEADNVEASVAVSEAALQKSGVSDYEILLIDCLRPDGTDDGTPAIAERLAKENPKIRHIHNEAHVNMGFKYRQGIQEAAGEYYMLIPGDNETEEIAIINVLEKLGSADIIIAYTSNPEVRSYKRRLVAKVFNAICNIISGYDIKHYNGICLHKTAVLRKLPRILDNLVYSADIIIRSMKSGLTKSYIEVPMPLKAQPGRRTNSFSGNNIVSAGLSFCKLFWDIRIRKRPI